MYVKLIKSSQNRPPCLYGLNGDFIFGHAVNFYVANLIFTSFCLVPFISSCLLSFLLLFYVSAKHKVVDYLLHMANLMETF